MQDLYQKYKNAIVHISTAQSSMDAKTITTDPNDNSQFIESTGFLIKYHNRIYAVTCAHNVLLDHTANHPVSHIFGTVNEVNGDPDSFRVFPMRIVGVDVHADIAVLKFEKHALHPCKTVNLEFGDNRNQRIGDVCWTSGNPLGSDESSFVTGTLRDNKLSGVNGLFIIELVSTNLLIYANNSGSPVLNNEGKVIGICSYTYQNTTTKDPLSGFAGGCGSYMMKPIVYNLINGKHSTLIRPNQQIEGCYPYYQYQKPYFRDTELLVVTSNYLLTNYPDNYENLDVVGFVLDILVSNSAFARAGLKEGDIITKMRDKRGKWVKLGHYEDYYAIGAVLWEYNPKYSSCVEIEYIPDPNYNCKRYYKTLLFDQGYPVDERLDTLSAYVDFISTVRLPYFFSITLPFDFRIGTSIFNSIYYTAYLSDESYTFYTGIASSSEFSSAIIPPSGTPRLSANTRYTSVDSSRSFIIRYTEGFTRPKIEIYNGPTLVNTIIGDI